jgi:hypothetical protein
MVGDDDGDGDDHDDVVEDGDEHGDEHGDGDCMYRYCSACGLKVPVVHRTAKNIYDKINNLKSGFKV